MVGLVGCRQESGCGCNRGFGLIESGVHLPYCFHGGQRVLAVATGLSTAEDNIRQEHASSEDSRLEVLKCRALVRRSQPPKVLLLLLLLSAVLLLSRLHLVLQQQE